MIDSYKILEVTDDEGEVHLLVGIKYIVIVTEPRSSIRNMTHSTSLVLCETKVPKQDRSFHTPMYLTREGIFMYLNVHGYPMVFSFLVSEHRNSYCQEIFRSIVRTYMSRGN